jgi:glycosyltransferase involved in cell wall biosynthesis
MSPPVDSLREITAPLPATCRVSVVIAAGADAEALRRTVASVIAQAGVTWQCLVVHDGRDPSADWPTEWRGAVEMVVHRDDREVAQINAGLALASGEFVAWLHPGEVYYRDTLRVVTERFAADPETQLVFGDAVLFDDHQRPVGRFRTRDVSAELLRRRCCLCRSSVFLRRSVLGKKQPLDAALGYWPDYDCWLRLAIAGERFTRVPELLSGSPVPAISQRGTCGPFARDNSLPAAEERNRILRQHLKTVPPDALVATGVAAVLEEVRWGRTRWLRFPAVLRHARAAGRRYNNSSQLPWSSLLSILFPRRVSEWRPLHRERRKWNAIESLKAQAADSSAVFQSRREELQRQRSANEISRFAWLRAMVSLLGRQAAIAAYRLGKGVETRFKAAVAYSKRRLFKLGNYAPRPLAVPRWYATVPLPEQPPVISIVTPNLNQGRHLAATIASVVDQGYPAVEFIVQDGGSRDESLEIIRRYSDRLAHWSSEVDKGQANAINLGLRHATGEILAYLNSDDILLPGSLACVARYFAEHPEVDVVYGHRVLIDERGDEIGRWVLPPHDDWVLGFVDFIPQETMFWRRSIWERTGGRLDEAFHFAMDWDLILRFREAGAKFARLPQFLGAFRISDDNKTSTQLETVGRRDIEILRKRVLGHVPSEREIRLATRGYFRRHWVFDKLYLAGLLRY